MHSVALVLQGENGLTQLDDTELRFVQSAIRRERLFFVLSMVGVIAGLALLVLTIRYGISGEEWGGMFALSILVLLNARQNLRQHKYARVLRKCGAGSIDPEARDDGQMI
jgi:hypothetical protein